MHAVFGRAGRRAPQSAVARHTGWRRGWLPIVAGAIWVAFARGGGGAVAASAPGPTLFWRHQDRGLNGVWIYQPNSTNRVVAAQTEPLADMGWEMAGSGDFNGDGQPDILWWHRTHPQHLVAVWYMRGATKIGDARLERSESDPDWRIQAVADFDGDGKPDLFWRHRATGANAIWYLDGVRVKATQWIEPMGGTRDALQWRVVGAADFGGPRGVPDGKPDLVWRHQSDLGGLNAVWLMDLPGQTNKLAALPLPSNPDLDYDIVAVAPFHPAGRPDLFWRHRVFGVNAIWFMDGTNRVGSTFVDPALETAWRVASQDVAESTWRLRRPGFPNGALSTGEFSAEAVETPRPQLTLRFSVPPSQGLGITLRKRSGPAAPWQSLASNLAGFEFVDTNVAVGTRYQYDVGRDQPPWANESRRYVLDAGLRAPPVEYRGRLLLVVDRTLSQALASSLEVFQADLEGDGWTISRMQAPRHDDARWSANTNAIVALKADIARFYRTDPARARGVVLIGHVPVPYSGQEATDGHVGGFGGPSHQGAWPADMYYADIDGGWVDGELRIPNPDHPDNANRPGDGKFDNSSAPSDLELFVGRVDFARLPSFTKGPAAVSEAELLRRYLDKNHRYRHVLPPFPLRPRAVAASSFAIATTRDGLARALYENARETASALWGGNLLDGALVAGNPFTRRSGSYLWGYAGGSGQADRINDAMPWQCTSADLRIAANEPQIGFYMLLGSYFGDWNMNDNFMRACLATPNYGLAAVWLIPAEEAGRWRFASMGLGGTLGDGLVETINHPGQRLWPAQRDRVLTILGDPTLRAQIVPPPTGLRARREGRGVRLSWEAPRGGGDDQVADVRYLVYLGNSRQGPFTNRLSGGPVADTTFVHREPPLGQKTYLVRSAVLQVGGSGSYTNLSQGALVVFE